MQGIKTLFEWYNLIYTLPFGLSVLLMVISAMGLGGHSSDADHDADLGADHDADLDADHDVDLEHDLDVDHDLDMDHDVDVDLDHDLEVDADHDLDLDHEVDLDHDLDHDIDHGADLDHEAEADQDVAGDHDAAHDGHSYVAAHQAESFLKALLSLLGVGKVPITVLIQSFLIAWAIIGWNANIWLAKAMRVPEAFILPSMAISFAGAVVVMRFMATCLSKLMPSSETYAKSPLELLTSTGTAVFRIGPNGGYADVHDETGTLHRVRCRCRTGVLPRGAHIMLVDYHGDGVFDAALRTPNGDGRRSTAAEAESDTEPEQARADGRLSIKD